MKPKVIWEDREIIVFDKPSGMVVNRASTTRGQETLEGWIEGNLRFPLANDSQFRNGIVHRLDKETSGVLLIAKTKEAFRELQRQFKTRSVEKTYLALLHGWLEPATGSLSLPLARARFDRERFAVTAGGKRALTAWKVRERFTELTTAGVDRRGYQGFSLVEVKPHSGRTHQIRVHMSHLGHPIVSDARYTGRKRAREDRKWCPRQFLHALRIAFEHPRNKKRMEYEVPLPEELRKVLALLE